MAGFRCAHTDFDGFAIAHLADQNDLGRLPQSGTQTVGIGVKIHPQLALVKGGFFMRVLIFNRIFQRDNMHGFVFIDFIQYGRQGRGFTGSGSAGDKNNPIYFRGNLEHGLGQFPLFDGRDFGLQFS